MKGLYSSCSGTTAKFRPSLAVAAGDQISIQLSVGPFPGQPICSLVCLLIYHAEVIPWQLRLKSGKVKLFSQYFRAWSCSAVKARNSVITQYSSDTDFVWVGSPCVRWRIRCGLFKLAGPAICGQLANCDWSRATAPCNNLDPTIESAKSSPLCCQVSKDTFSYKM